MTLKENDIAAACPVCSSETIEEVFHNDAVLSRRTVFFCRSCLLYFINPLPTDEELKELYENEWSWDFGMPSKRGLRRQAFYFIYKMHQQFVARERLRKLVETIGDKDASILEVGSGNGSFLRKAATYYNSAAGVEPSITGDFTGGNIQIRKMAINEKMALDKQYDAICAYMVVEHMNRPLEILQNLSGHLKANGKMFIEVPYSPLPDALRGMSLFEKEKLFNNVHLFHFSRKSIKKVADRLNMRLKAVEVFRKYEFIPGFNVFSVYPGASRRGIFYKMVAALNLMVIYMRGIAGVTVHETVNNENGFADGYWIRFILEKQVMQ